MKHLLLTVAFLFTFTAFSEDKVISLKVSEADHAQLVEAFAVMYDYEKLKKADGTYPITKERFAKVRVMLYIKEIQRAYYSKMGDEAKKEYMKINAKVADIKE